MIVTRYLVVAHQTIDNPALIFKLTELARVDPESEFTLLVPATSVEHLATWTEGESKAIAERSAEHARELFRSEGINISRTIIGDESPIVAIDDEMRSHPDAYDAIVVSTFPSGISRWLGLDLPRRVDKKYQQPVIHVVAQPERVAVRGRSR